MRFDLRQGYVAGRVLCRAVLSQYTGIEPRVWRFYRGVNGKPSVLEPAKFSNLFFSVSRTKGFAICLVSLMGDVGVDVEETTHTVDVLQVARHFFSYEEQSRLAKLAAVERRKRFFEQWVLKEAYLKGTGTGLAWAPERLTIEPGRIRDWQFSLHRPDRNHIAAAAVHSLGGRPVPVRWLEAQQLFETDVTVVGARVPNGGPA